MAFPGPDAAIELKVTGLPASAAAAQVTHYRIDQDHSNSYTAWKQLGSPIAPPDVQYADLEKAGQLTQLAPVERVGLAEGAATLRFTLPRQGVSLLLFELPDGS